MHESRCLHCVLLLSVVLSCGLSPARPGRLNASVPLPTFHSGPYLLQPGDELEIRFFHTPDMDVVLPVRPDGCISLPLVYELRVAGRTVEELRLELIERYSAELAEPELAVIVRSFGTYPVHVGGAVDSPGVLQLSGTYGVLDAVLAAGGFVSTSDLDDVLVMRRTDGTGYDVLNADLEAFLEGRSGDGNFSLRPYDVVYVPSSPIADVNQWVEQYLRNNIPLTFSYRLND